jgi:hypothetical protein
MEPLNELLITITTISVKTGTTVEMGAAIIIMITIAPVEGTAVNVKQPAESV